MKNALKRLLALLVLLPLLGPAVPHNVAADPGSPLDVGVYEEDFTTYTYKDYTENTEWDIWTNTLRVSRPDGPQQARPAVTVNLPDGSLIAVWDDTRHSADFDIYAQKLDAEGNRLWPADVRVNSDSGTARQTYPAVAVDGSGNAVVVWGDTRNGDYDIYGQKLNTSGSKMWATDLRVNSESGTTDQYWPTVAVDGSGNTIVAWADKRNGNWDIYAQKLDTEGNRPWPADVHVNSDSGTADQWFSVVGMDGSGNAIVVWEDYRSGDWDIYAQKLDGSGNKLWAIDLRVNSDSGMTDQHWPTVAVDGNGNAVLAWEDDRNGDGDIYAQKLDTGGNRLWPADVRVNSDSGTAWQVNPAVAMGGDGNATVVWKDERNGDYDIYGQKLNTSGNKLWATDLRVNSDSGATDQHWPTVAVDGSGNGVVVWGDKRNGNWDIYAQKLDASGNRPWAADLRVNSDSGMASQYNPAVAVDASGNVVVVWLDYRNGDGDIYAQKLDGGGNKLWAADLRVNSDTGTADQGMLATAVDGSGNALVVWEDERNGNWDIYAQKLDASGNKLWAADLRVNSDGGIEGQYNPVVAADGAGNVVVVWHDWRNGNDDIYAQKLDGSGNNLWAADLRVNSDSGTTEQEHPAVAVNGSGNAVVAWQETRNADCDIYAQKLDVNGLRLWLTDVQVNANGDVQSHTHLALAIAGDGDAIIAWADQRNGPTDIYAQRLEGSGNKLWESDVHVDSASTGGIYQFPWPAVAADGSGNAVVTWHDWRNGDPDVNAQKLDTSGSKLWAGDVQVVYPDLFYLPAGTAQSRSVDATNDPITEATFTAQYIQQGGSVTFYLTNDGGANWAEVAPGVTHVFTTAGSDLRWRLEMASDPVWRTRAPIIESLRIEYHTASASGDDYEPDDACAQAQPVQIDGPAQQHDFHQADDADWAWFDATAGQTYIVQTVGTGPRADTQIELHDGCGQPPAQFGYNAFGPDVTLTFQAPVSGTYYVKVLQSDGSIYGPDTEYELSVRTPTPGGMGAAIIVAGRNREDDPLQPIINATANLAYQTFLRSGFSAGDVMYLNADAGQPGVDDTPTKVNIRDAVQDWARTRVGLGLPLWVYLADHGQVDRFHNDVGEVVTAAELNLWLSNIEATSGVDQVNVVIDACYSGSFIDTYQSGAYGLDEISGHGRVVVGSTSSRWFAYAPYIVPGQPTPLMYFSDGFWHALDQGHDIWSAFLIGRATVEAAGQLCGDYDYVCQRPWLDDTGDAWFDSTDGQVAQGRGLAASFGSAIPPYIDWLEVSDVTQGQATIQAQVRDDGSITRVWARVFAPSFQPPQTTDGSVPIVQVPEVELDNTGDDLYQLEYSGFTEAGAYQVVLYALDDEGNAAMPKWVESRESGFDTVLKTVSPQGPVTYGDTLTYTVIISVPPGTRVGLFDPLEGSTWVGFVGQPPGDVTHVDSIDGTLYLGGVVSGTLEVTPTNQVAVSFVTRITIPGTAGWTMTVTNRACVFPLGGTLGTCIWSNEVANPALRPYEIYLPLVLRGT